MWIVRLALRRPYTFVVMAVLIAILGGTAIVTMPVDIFPYIDIPIVSVVWPYYGLSPEEMEKRVVTNFERELTSGVNDIEHLESQSYRDIAVVRIYFHPNVQIDMALAQVTAGMQSALRSMPPGMFPARVLKYDAGSVPILKLGLSSKTLREQEIFDLGRNFIQTPLATVQGAAVSYPFGGKNRAVMVDLNLDELYAKQLAPIDVSNALNLQNLILPAGTAKLAETEYQIRVNSSPINVDEFNNLPIKTVNGATVYMKDVAQVRDGFSVQSNIVRTDGARGVMLSVTRTGKASTLAVVNAVKAALPRILASVPPELKVVTLADQSIFVRASIQGVEREAMIAAGLTALMILLFLGSWRSTLIVCISIPLSILASLSILSLLGQTINVMTLGGLALAVGILVDDATVAVENTHRNIGLRKPLVRAVIDGAAQIAIPTFVSTVAICIVFVPVLLLTGTAKFLFTPLAMAVVFAMLASYLLSRTLVPTMAHYLLKSEVEMYQQGIDGEAKHGKGPFWRLHYWFDGGFERLRFRYLGLLDWSLRHRAPVLAAFLVFAIGSVGLAWLIGEDFFPNVDSGQMRLEARAPAGTRLEQTEVRFAAIEREIRNVIPAAEMDTLIDNIGVVNCWACLAAGEIPTISSADGEILISLKKDHGSTRDYEVKLRKHLRERFPDTTFFFNPANTTTQILNFGLPAPIDAQVVGRDAEGNYKVAQRLAERISHIPGAADVHVHQVLDQPEIRLNVDRIKASQLGLTQRDVTTSMLISLSGSGQVAPNYWMNWANGVNYTVGVQTPQYKIDSLDALLRTPVSVASNAVNVSTTGSPAGAAGNASVGASPSGSSQAYGNPGAIAGSTQLLSNLVTVERGTAPVIVNHYNVQPVFDVYANVDRRDLGGVGSAVEKIIEQERTHLPRVNVTRFERSCVFPVMVPGFP
jgi:multidrug efflux pump subunit AcrB